MKIIVFGSGCMGTATAFDLVKNDAITEVVLADIDPERLRKAKAFIGSDKIKTKKVDVSDYDAVVNVIRGYDAAISCVTYMFNYTLARAAVYTGVNFCDLGGNNDTVDEEFSLHKKAEKASITVIPDCGLAPGMVSMFTAYADSHFDQLDEVHIRVGGIPRYPKPPLNYQCTWSIRGLLNEYYKPTLVIKNGREQITEPMGDIEEIIFPKPFGKMEAFSTSGGISTLPKTFIGLVRELNYKTIRYPGHCAQMNAMLKLGLADKEPIQVNDIYVSPRDLFEKLLAKNLVGHDEDVVLVRVTSKGKKNNKNGTLVMTVVDYHDKKTGLSAMMRMTGFSISIIAQMLASGEITQKGVLPQEVCVPVDKYIAGLRERNIQLVIIRTTEV